MTVETEVTRVIVEGNGVTTTYSYSFPIPGSSATDQTNAELILLGTDSSITTLADNLWSLTGVGTGVGGTFIYNPGTPLTTGAFLTLNRIVPYEQTTTLSAQGAYSPTVVEAALDNIVFQTEQNNTRLLQSLRVPITDDAISDYPTAAERAGGFAGFAPTTGDAMVLFGTPGSAIFVGTNSTSTSSVQTLLLTGPAVASVSTAGGVATATFASTVDITDGTHTVSAATSLTFLNGTVGGSNPSATYTAPASGGGGGLVWLGTFTATGSATTIACEGVISATYNVYKFVFTGITMQTSTANLGMQIGTGGTPTYDTAGNYSWMKVGVILGSPTTPIAAGTSGDTSAQLALSLGSTAGFCLGGDITFHNFNSTSLRKNYSGTIEYINSTPSQLVMTIGGEWSTTATAVTALRLISSSGNIAAGSVYVYGMQKS